MTNSKSMSKTMSKSTPKQGGDWKGYAAIGVATVAGAGLGALGMNAWTEHHQEKVVSREQVEAAKMVMSGLD